MFVSDRQWPQLGWPARPLWYYLRDWLERPSLKWPICVEWQVKPKLNDQSINHIMASINLGPTNPENLKIGSVGPTFCDNWCPGGSLKKECKKQQQNIQSGESHVQMTDSCMGQIVTEDVNAMQHCLVDLANNSDKSSLFEFLSTPVYSICKVSLPRV